MILMLLLQCVDPGDVGVGHCGDSVSHHCAAGVGVCADVSPGLLQPPVEQGGAYGALHRHLR